MSSVKWDPNVQRWRDERGRFAKAPAPADPSPAYASSSSEAWEQDKSMLQQQLVEATKQHELDKLRFAEEVREAQEQRLAAANEQLELDKLRFAEEMRSTREQQLAEANRQRELNEQRFAEMREAHVEHALKAEATARSSIAEGSSHRSSSVPAGAAWREAADPNRRRHDRDGEEGTGFRMIAPDVKQRAEMNRIREKDSANLQMLRDQKRTQAMQHIRSSTPTRLGFGSRGAVGMQEARLSFVERLEQESNPKFRRQRRKEEERRQREEEHTKHQAEKERRLQQHSERQTKLAARDRELNKVKQAHWQAISESSAGATPNSSAVSASAPSRVNGGSSPLSLVGKWVFGSKANEYFITRAPDGQMLFDGPNPSGGRLIGTLVVQQDTERFEAEVMSGDGTVFGIMDFLLQEGAGPVTLVSRFRKPGLTDWGKDIVASKASTSSAQAAGNITKVDDADCGIAKQFAPQRPASGKRLEDTNFWQCAMCTLTNEPNASSCVACDNSRPPPHFLLAWEHLEKSGPGSHDGLLDPDVWQCTTCTLVNEGIAYSCVACESPRPRPPPCFVPDLPGAAPEEVPTEGSAPAIAQTSAPQMVSGVDLLSARVGEETVLEEAIATKDGLLSWLRRHRLEDYHASMVEHGFDELKDLLVAEQSDLDNMFTLVGVKAGHMLRFRGALRRGHDGGVIGSPRECPVCLSGAQKGVNVVLTPCGHVFCAEHASQAHKKGVCPCCRARPSGTQRIFA